MDEAHFGNIPCKKEELLICDVPTVYLFPWYTEALTNMDFGLYKMKLVIFCVCVVSPYVPQCHQCLLILLPTASQSLNPHMAKSSKWKYWVHNGEYQRDPERV